MRLYLLLAFLSAALCLHAQNTDINSEQVAYDYLLLSSISGNTPLSSYSVSPLSLYSICKRNPSTAQDDLRRMQATSSSSLQTFLYDTKRYLYDYYTPLTGVQSPDSEESWLGAASFAPQRRHIFFFADSTARIMADINGMARIGTTNVAGQSEFFTLGRLSARVMGSLGEHFGFMADFSNGVRVQGLSSRIAMTDAVLSRTLKFVGDEQKFFDKYIGYVQYQSEHLRIRFGREQYSWGFSPIDNLVHSRYAPLSDALILDVPYKSLRFSYSHAAIEGINIKGESFAGKFVGSHRLQANLASWCSVALNDMIVYSGRGIDLAYVNPLGFYVSTGLGTKEKSDFDNSIIGAECLFRFWQNGMLYAALVADDIDFSTLSDTSWRGNNNKYAYQAGVSQLLAAFEHPLLLSAEYVRITPFTYSHRQVNNSWTHLGAPLGYNMQSNSDRIALQGKYWFTPRTFVQLDADYTRWGENILDAQGNILTAEFQGINYPIGNMGGNMLRGDGDFLYPEQFRVHNKFLRGRLSHTRRIGLWLSAEVYPTIFTDIRIQHTNRNGGNNPLQQTWASFELRIGY